MTWYKKKRWRRQVIKTSQAMLWIIVSLRVKIIGGRNICIEKMFLCNLFIREKPENKTFPGNITSGLNFLKGFKKPCIFSFLIWQSFQIFISHFLGNFRIFSRFQNKVKHSFKGVANVHTVDLDNGPCTVWEWALGTGAAGHWAGLDRENTPLPHWHLWEAPKA